MTIERMVEKIRFNCKELTSESYFNELQEIDLLKKDQALERILTELKEVVDSTLNYLQEENRLDDEVYNVNIN